MRALNSESLATIILAIFTSTGLWNFLVYLVSSRSKRKTVEKEALLALLHDKLYTLAEDYLCRGHITVKELDNLTHLYSAYRKLGGNGTGEELYNRCKLLPVRESND